MYDPDTRGMTPDQAATTKWRTTREVASAYRKTMGTVLNWEKRGIGDGAGGRIKLESAWHGGRKLYHIDKHLRVFFGMDDDEEMDEIPLLDRRKRPPNNGIQNPPADPEPQTRSST